MRVGEPTERWAARVVLLSPAGRVLLFRGGDPYRPELVFWHTPGGGLEPGESYEQAAARELAEETGYLLDPGGLAGPLWERTFDFGFAGERYRQHERYFLYRVDAEFSPDTSGFEAWERVVMTRHVWWDEAAMRACTDHLAPPDLADRLATLGST